MMGLIALASVITTSATVVIYGRAIWDPVELAGTLAGPFVLLGLIVITIDTVSCNIAANLVSSAYDFSSLWPARISYRTGGMITAAIGVLIMPWKLLATTGGYIFIWLAGYSALLGPIAGILIADYWLIRRTRLDVDALYRAEGLYAYRRGWNPAALAAFAAGVLPNLPGFLKTAAPGAFGWIGPGWAAAYTYAWFIGLFVALAVYAGLMWRPGARLARAAPG
jgi:nucleobase:cation symporter-1, NCS1 family